MTAACAAGQPAPDTDTRQAHGRLVAVTIDDLPYTGGAQRLPEAADATDRILAALAHHRVPAAAFVTGSNVLVAGEVDARLDLLRRWRDAGHRLENHSCAHQPFHRTEVDAYLDDVVCGNVLPALLMAERGAAVRFFRAPMNSTGPTAAARAALDTFLTSRGLLLAPFTVEHADYAVNALYVDALARGDTAQARRLGVAYLAQLDSAFTFAERLSRETFGREFPQVFLIHANRLNADYLGAMLDHLAARGYRFVGLGDAVADPVYQTPDPYVGPYGISWLHRWRRALGLPKRQADEPDYPRWLYDAYERLGAR